MKKITTNILRGMIDEQISLAAMTYHCSFESILKSYVDKWNKGFAFSDSLDMQCGFYRLDDTSEEFQAFVKTVNAELEKDIIRTWMQNLEPEQRKTVISLLKKGETILLQHGITVTWKYFTDNPGLL